jgi:hypothetical protein
MKASRQVVELVGEELEQPELEAALEVPEGVEPVEVLEEPVVVLEEVLLVLEVLWVLLEAPLELLEVLTTAVLEVEVTLPAAAVAGTLPGLELTLPTAATAGTLLVVEGLGVVESSQAARAPERVRTARIPQTLLVNMLNRLAGK